MVLRLFGNAETKEMNGDTPTQTIYTMPGTCTALLIGGSGTLFGTETKKSYIDVKENMESIDQWMDSSSPYCLFICVLATTLSYAPIPWFYSQARVFDPS